MAVTVPCGLEELSVNVPSNKTRMTSAQTGHHNTEEGGTKYIPSDNVGSRNTISIWRRRQLRLLLLDDGGSLGRRRRHSKSSRGKRNSEIQKTLVDNEADDKLNAVIEKTEKKSEEREIL